MSIKKEVKRAKKSVPRHRYGELTMAATFARAAVNDVVNLSKLIESVENDVKKESETHSLSAMHNWLKGIDTATAQEELKKLPDTREYSPYIFAKLNTGASQMLDMMSYVGLCLWAELRICDLITEADYTLTEGLDSIRFASYERSRGKKRRIPLEKTEELVQATVLQWGDVGTGEISPYIFEYRCGGKQEERLEQMKQRALQGILRNKEKYLTCAATIECFTCGKIDWVNSYDADEYMACGWILPAIRDVMARMTTCGASKMLIFCLMAALIKLDDELADNGIGVTEDNFNAMARIHFGGTPFSEYMLMIEANVADSIDEAVHKLYVNDTLDDEAKRCILYSALLSLRTNHEDVGSHSMGTAMYRFKTLKDSLMERRISMMGSGVSRAVGHVARVVLTGHLTDVIKLVGNGEYRLTKTSEDGKADKEVMELCDTAEELINSYLGNVSEMSDEEIRDQACQLLASHTFALHDDLQVASDTSLALLHRARTFLRNEAEHDNIVDNENKELRKANSDLEKKLERVTRKNQALEAREIGVKASQDELKRRDNIIKSRDSEIKRLKDDVSRLTNANSKLIRAAEHSGDTAEATQELLDRISELESELNSKTNECLELEEKLADFETNTDDEGNVIDFENFKDDLLKLIGNRRVYIAGGSDKWGNKFEGMFNRMEHRIADEVSWQDLTNSDVVIMSVRQMPHRVSNQITGVCRERGIPFVIFTGSNVDQAAWMLYAALLQEAGQGKAIYYRQEDTGSM